MSQTALPLSARRLSDDHAGGTAPVRAEAHLGSHPHLPPDAVVRPPSLRTAPDTAAWFATYSLAAIEAP